MNLNIFKNKQVMGAAAAKEIAEIINQAISQQDQATIILATGASQFEILENLVQADVDWTKVTAFHLDEYIGLPESHPASFRKYLKERFTNRVGNLGAFHYVNGEAEAKQECDRVGDLIQQYTIDVACIGIGENGHIAFNDPPADFDTGTPYIVVELDEACRKQQFGEGWFPTLGDVPKRAISMSVKHIMKSNAIVCTVPDERKAKAVKAALQGKVTNMVPASILQIHPHCSMYLDSDSAALLEK